MTAGKILHKYGIRKTNIREKILNALLKNGEGLTCAEIIHRIKSTKSRASVLRTLSLYQVKGFVHNSMNPEAKRKFFYSEKRDISITYFICTRCNKLYVFNVPIPGPVKLPDMEVLKIEHVIFGICKNCS